MILVIHDLLKEGPLAELRKLLERGSFEDGRRTAGRFVEMVKNNEQLTNEGRVREQAMALIEQALREHRLFQAAAHPRRIRSPMFSRYTQGMQYGAHVDNGLMGPDLSFRTDISMTIFISDPGDYDGGELVVESSVGERGFKLDAGSALLYPSNTLHRVAEVTRGTRLVGLTWVQSMIRSAEQRQILLDMYAVRQGIFERDGKTREFDLIAKSYDNLLRLWAEP